MRCQNKMDRAKLGPSRSRERQVGKTASNMEEHWIIILGLQSRWAMTPESDKQRVQGTIDSIYSSLCLVSVVCRKFIFWDAPRTHDTMVYPQIHSLKTETQESGAGFCGTSHQHSSRAVSINNRLKAYPMRRPKYATPL